MATEQVKSILKKREEGYVPGTTKKHGRRVSISPRRRIRLFVKDDDEPLTEEALAIATRNLDLSKKNDMAAVAKSKTKSRGRASPSPRMNRRGKSKVASSPRRKAKSKAKSKSKAKRAVSPKKRAIAK